MKFKTTPDWLIERLAIQITTLFSVYLTSKTGTLVVESRRFLPSEIILRKVEHIFISLLKACISQKSLVTYLEIPCIVLQTWIELQNQTVVADNYQMTIIFKSDLIHAYYHIFYLKGVTGNLLEDSLLSINDFNSPKDLEGLKTHTLKVLINALFYLSHLICISVVYKPKKKKRIFIIIHIWLNHLIATLKILWHVTGIP